MNKMRPASLTQVPLSFPIPGIPLNARRCIKTFPLFFFCSLVSYILGIGDVSLPFEAQLGLSFIWVSDKKIKISVQYRKGIKNIGYLDKYKGKFTKSLQDSSKRHNGWRWEVPLTSHHQQTTTSSGSTRAMFTLQIIFEWNVPLL